jgi:multidrug resistance protein, MATE family
MATAAPLAPATLVGWVGHVRALLGLGVPLMLSSLAGFAIHLTDTVLMGWYDITALAGMVLASSLYIVVFITGSGFAAAVMPLVATAAERGDAAEVRRVTRMGLWLTLGFTALTLPVLVFAGPILRAMGQDPQVADYAGRYLAIGGWVLVPALVIALLRSFLSALEHTSVLLAATIGGAVFNAVAGYALIFGAWGLPEMGIEGAAIVAVLTNLLIAAALIAYALIRLPEYQLTLRLWKPDWEALRRVFVLGWPISGQLLAEVGLFAGSSVMMGWVGPVELAAHGVALQLASLTFMLHLGLSQAATVRTGQAVGRLDWVGLRQGAIVAITLSAVFAVLASAVFLLLPETLIGAFTDPEDPARARILVVGATLLAFAALFQLFDGAQVLAIGLLRGIEDTTVPMVIAAVSYWGIGLPLAYGLGFWTPLAEAGIWLGLVASLLCASAALLWRFRARVKDRA